MRPGADDRSIAASLGISRGDVEAIFRHLQHGRPTSPGRDAARLERPRPESDPVARARRGCPIAESTTADWFLDAPRRPRDGRGAGWPAWGSATPSAASATSATWPAAAGRTRDVLARLAVQLDAVLPALPRPGHGADEPRAVRRRRPDARGDARRCWPSNARTTEIAAPALQHQPALQRADDPRPVAARLAPAGAERRDREALIDDLWAELAGGPDDEAAAAGPPPVPPPRDPPDRLQRHRPRPPAGTDHARPLAPGRRLRRGRLPAGPRGTPRRGTASPAGRDGRPGPVRRPGPGQARRRRS